MISSRRSLATWLLIASASFSPACGAAKGSTKVASPGVPAEPTIVESGGYKADFDRRSPGMPPPPPPAVAMSESVARPEAADSVRVLSASTEESGSVSTGSSGGASPPNPVPTTVATSSTMVRGATDVTPTEMLEIEAHITIEVEKVNDAAAKLRTLTKEQGGQVINDVLRAEAGNSGASFALRVPSNRAELFLTALGEVGTIKSRQVNAKDVGKEFHDAQIVLQNLEATLHRYEEILSKATDVKQILEIENELSRVRGQIDRVKGDLRFMKDRTSRATIYVTLTTSRPDVEPTWQPEAKMYPGVRGTFVADMRGGSYGTKTYVGAGISLMFARAFSVDIDFMRSNGALTSGLDLLLVTAGGEFYSDFLGGGKRHWFNPYIGFRGGYANFLGKSEAALGGMIGLEIYRAKSFLIDSQVRMYAFFGDSQAGAHTVVQPALAINVSF